MVTATRYAVIVTDHARVRARSRFPGFKAARIVDEVRAALAGGRVSVQKPEGIAPPDDPTCLYVWTPDGGRAYAIRADEHHVAFVVKTTMRAR